MIKVVWGREWDDLLARDNDGVLVHQMNTTLDGEFQKYAVETGEYIREHFFGPDPRLQKMVEHLSDDDLRRLRRGGHDYRKLYAAYASAVELKDAPVVILAKTVKGWGLGRRSRAATSRTRRRSSSEEELKTFRDRLELPIRDEEINEGVAALLPPGQGLEEIQYMLAAAHDARWVPSRSARPSRQEARTAPKDDLYEEFDAGLEASSRRRRWRSSGCSASCCATRRSATASCRSSRTRHARSGWSRCSPTSRSMRRAGQLYDPVDSAHLLAYREAKKGQILEEGITEAGSMGSFTAAGTSYATHGETMIPFFIFYSMFGFQRIGDLIWSFGDQRGRGFLLGATYGRTTLNGEGLQHQDGHTLADGFDEPGMSVVRPGLRLRDGDDRARGLAPDDGERRGRLLLHNALQRELRACRRCPTGVKEGILDGLYPFRPRTGQ